MTGRHRGAKRKLRAGDRLTVRRHYNAGPIYASCSCVAQVLYFISSVVSCALSACAHYVGIRPFGHHPHP